MPQNINVLGIPFAGGQPRKGTELAPKMLLDMGLVDAIAKSNIKVNDISSVENDIPSEASASIPNTKLNNSKQVGNYCHKVASTIETALHSDSAAPLMVHVGGDHSVAIGTISGMLTKYKDDLCVVWVDAHADINTPTTSLSGNMHGMPVAFLAKDETLVKSWSFPGFEWMATFGHKHGLQLSQLVFIGLRDVDPAEEDILKQYNIKQYTMNDVREIGIEKVLQETKEYLKLDTMPTRRLHLSFDVDGCDPAFFPATGTPAKGGLTLDEGKFICKTAAQTGKLVGVDIVEVNPKLGATEEEAKRTVQNSIALVESIVSNLV